MILITEFLTLVQKFADKINYNSFSAQCEFTHPVFCEVVSGWSWCLGARKVKEPLCPIHEPKIFRCKHMRRRHYKNPSSSPLSLSLFFIRFPENTPILVASQVFPKLFESSYILQPRTKMKSASYALIALAVCVAQTYSAPVVGVFSILSMYG